MSGSRFVFSVVVAMAVAGGSAAGPAGQQEKAHGGVGETVASHGLPASLDALYPPQARQPEFLLHMVNLGAQLTGVVVDLGTGDLEHLAGSLAAFEAAYRQTAELVPEWRERFLDEPVTSLGEAVASGDPERVGPALAAVGDVCDSCHHDNMVAVTQRYHWSDFYTITATDPVSSRTVAFPEFMHMLEFSLTGVTHDLSQGQVDSARKHYQDFRQRFVALGEVCEDCHGVEERFYFTDAVSAARVEGMGSALEAVTPDPAAVQAAASEVGFNTCHRCHLVHVPAAFAMASSVQR